jgi:ammonium transporter Rh
MFVVVIAVVVVNTFLSFFFFFFQKIRIFFTNFLFVVQQKGPWSEDVGTREGRRSHALTEGRVFICASLAWMSVLIVLMGIWFDYAVGHFEEQMELYPYFRDVLIMVLFGFGMLMSFLRRYGFSANGYTLLITALCVPWSLLLGAFFKRLEDDTASIGDTYFVGLEDMLDALFCSATLLITFGAVIGKTTPLQLLVLVIVEPILFWVNIYVIIFKLGAHDVGGGMTIHLFGAIFGLAMSFLFTWRFETHAHPDNTSCYSSDLAALGGSIFLWIMWPSFNAAIAVGDGQVRAIINTVASLCGATLSALVASRFIGGNRFDVVHVQNSILAGGVAMGVAADLDVTIGGAAATGLITGAISSCGYVYVTPWLAHRFNMQDVCGVTNLHGIPGLISALVGIIATAALDDSLFAHGSSQPVYQMSAMFVTIGIALAGGFVLSALLRFVMAPLNHIAQWNFFNDRTFWHLPSDYDAVAGSGLTQEDML